MGTLLSFAIYQPRTLLAKNSFLATIHRGDMKARVASVQYFSVSIAWGAMCPTLAAFGFQDCDYNVAQEILADKCKRKQVPSRLGG